MRVLHVCKFSAAGASRVLMQLSWDHGAVMDVDSEVSAGHPPLSYRTLFALIKTGHLSAIVFHMQSSVPYLLFALAARSLLRSQVSLVYDIHDLNEWKKAGTVYSRLRFCAFWFLERLAIRGADNVLTVSRGLAQLYFRRYRRPLIIVYNAPADHSQTLGVPVAPRAGLVYFGLVNKMRMPQHVIDTIVDAGLPVDVYGIVEETDSAYLAWLDDGAKSGRVRLKGRYRAADLEFLMKYSYALLVFDEGELNVRYCLPNKLFQAILHGLPCVLSHGLIECRIKFKRFPEFVYAMPQQKEQLTRFFALPQSPRGQAAIMKFIAGLHEQSRQRYMACLAGRGA